MNALNAVLKWHEKERQVGRESIIEPFLNDVGGLRSKTMSTDNNG